MIRILIRVECGRHVNDYLMVYEDTYLSSENRGPFFSFSLLGLLPGECCCEQLNSENEKKLVFKHKISRFSKKSSYTTSIKQTFKSRVIKSSFLIMLHYIFIENYPLTQSNRSDLLTITTTLRPFKNQFPFSILLLDVLLRGENLFGGAKIAFKIEKYR